MAGRRSMFVARDADGTGTAPQDARLALLGLLPTVGVLNGLAVTGSTSGSNMKYAVSAGTAVCARGVPASDGVYPAANDGAFTADSAAPAPSSGTRWDLVWIQARNTSDGFGDAKSDTLIGVTVGVAAASNPVKPYLAGSGVSGTSVPAGALVLAEALVGTGIANASQATITRVVKPVAPRGGIVKASGSNFYPTAPEVDDLIVDATLGLMRWDGTAWRSYGNGVTPSGGVNLAATNAATGYVRNTGAATGDVNNPLQGGMQISGSGLIVPVDGWYTLSLSSSFTAGTVSTTARRAVTVGAGTAASPTPATSVEMTVNNQNNASGTMSTSGSLWLPAGTVLSAWRYTDVSGNYGTCDARLKAVLAART